MVVNSDGQCWLMMIAYAWAMVGIWIWWWISVVELWTTVEDDGQEHQFRTDRTEVAGVRWAQLGRFIIDYTDCCWANCCMGSIKEGPHEGGVAILKAPHGTTNIEALCADEATESCWTVGHHRSQGWIFWVSNVSFLCQNIGWWRLMEVLSLSFVGKSHTWEHMGIGGEAIVQNELCINSCVVWANSRQISHKSWTCPFVSFLVWLWHRL